MEATEVEVNHVPRDQFKMAIVGLPDAAVRESLERMLSAISNSAMQFGTGINTINLAPADLKKEGPSFDLLLQSLQQQRAWKKK